MTKLTFSPQEKHDLLVAWALLSISFGIANVVAGGDALSVESVAVAALIAGITVGVGFIVHELAHKYVAIKYGKYAEFHASIPFLILALFMSFFGTLFAAPGAVVISGYVTKRESGHIAAAGPLSNIILAVLVLPLFIFMRSGIAGDIIAAFYGINVWLALFNMIPLFVFDGAKILAWSKKWYFVTLAICIGLLVIQIFPW